MTRSRLIKGAEVLSRIEHPHVIEIYEHFDVPKCAGIVLRFMEQGSVRQLIKSEGALRSPQALEIMKQVLQGLAVVHQAKVIHRDIKPDNILLAMEGGQRICKLADFGIVRDRKGHGTVHHASLGTFAYMSPEQIRGIAPSFRSDLYSCGVMLFEMLTGTAPFVGSDYEIKNAHVHCEPDWSRLPRSTPTFVEAALRLALAKDPLRRFESAGAFADALSNRRETELVPFSHQQKLKVGSLSLTQNEVRQSLIHEGKEDRSASIKWSRRRRLIGVISLRAVLLPAFAGLLFALFIKEGSATMKSAERLVESFTNLFLRISTPKGFVRIAAGRFTMGSPLEEQGLMGDAYDERQHSVTLEHDFLMGKTEVTQSQYVNLMSRNPSAVLGQNHPVTNVSWFDAVQFANKLSEQEGYSACYDQMGKVKVAGSIYKCSGYRLPTETEWEYDARAGSPARRYGPLDAIAWYKENTKAPRAVGLK